ncbi:MAG: PEP-CTERM sorting domain-containing protein [Cyanobacteriota bacterium]
MTAPVLAVTLIELVSTRPAAAVSFIRSFSTSGIVTNGPEGIAFDPFSGNLFLSNGDGKGQNTIYEFTTSGALINSFKVSLNDVRGVDILPNGNLLLSNSIPANQGGGLFEYTKTGLPVESGVNLIIDPPSSDPDSTVFHEGTSTIFVVDDVDEKIYEFALDGKLLNTINTLAINPNFKEPEGITFDPLTNNLLIAGDNQGARSLYELTLAGELVDVINVEEVTGLTDPEGITIDPATRTLYVAFDSDEAVGAFSLGDAPASVPEPTTGLGVLVFGAFGAGSLLKRKQKQTTI